MDYKKEEKEGKTLYRIGDNLVAIHITDQDKYFSLPGYTMPEEKTTIVKHRSQLEAIATGK